MQACSILDDKQFTKEISDYLTNEKLAQINRPDILISIPAFEKHISRKFKCSVELDRKRIIQMLESISSSRNKYLEISAKGRQIQKFVLITSDTEQSDLPKNIIPLQSTSIPFDLSPCFSGKVQIEKQDITTTNWPEGILLVPNFLNKLERSILISELNNPKFDVVKLECLRDLFIQYNFATSIPDKPSIHFNDSKSSGIKIDMGERIILSIGNPASFSASHNGKNIHIPLISGSLIRINQSLHGWNLQITPPKMGINFIVQFRGRQAPPVPPE